MCGRFTLTTPSDELAAAFPDFAFPEDQGPRYNIAPGQYVLVVPNTQERLASLYRWGLVPHWAKDPAIGNRLINARAETLNEKPSFRLSFRKRRCLVLADGFFEWRKEGKYKIPFYVRMKEGRPFAMAGLWDIWQSDSGDTLRSCTIITTEANGIVAPIHDRMPVILDPARYSLWLSGPDAASPGELHPFFLGPYSASEMEAYAVSALVNTPANDSPECVAPLPAGLHGAMPDLF